MNRLLALSVVVAVVCWAGAAQAQVFYSGPVVTYYAPAPTTVYYAPAPAAVYYAPPAVAYPAPVVVTRYRPILGGTVSRVRYHHPAIVRPWRVGYRGYYWW